MPMLEGGTQKSRQTGKQQSTAGGQARPLYDLVLRALMGNLAAPQETDIPVPLQQAVSGYQDLMPAVMGQAFGPGASTGLASRLSGGPSTPSSSSPPTSAAPGASPWLPTPGGPPAFGMQSREALGLGKPSVVDERFLPPTESIIDELPPVRTSTPTRRQSRQQARLAGLQAKRDTRAEAGLGTAKLDRKIARKERRQDRRYIE